MLLSESLAKLVALDPPPRIYLIATGAGAGIQHKLWVPGISRVLVGASFPYSAHASQTEIGYVPEKAVCGDVAWALAHAAYVKAKRSDADARGKAIGLGLTAAVTTYWKRKGANRACIAVISEDYESMREIQVDNDDRQYQDARFEEHALELLFEAAGVHERLSVGQNADGSYASFWKHPGWGPNGRRLTAPDDYAKMVLFPGAFNPPHAGHRAILAQAERVTGKLGCYCVSSDPPHKPPLRVPEMLDRAATLDLVLFIAGAPLYISKARRFPGTTFIIGYDALVRMLDPKWCPVIPMLNEFVQLGTNFLVVGRQVPERKTFHQLSDIQWPEGATSAHRAIFTELPGRWDISSTELREKST